MASIPNTSSVASSSRPPVAYGGGRQPNKVPCLLCQKDFITRTPQGEYPHLNECPDIPEELKPFSPKGQNYQGINDFVGKMTAWIMKNKPESLNIQRGAAVELTISNSQPDVLAVQQPQQQPYDPYAYRASWQPKQINCPFCETPFVAHVPEDQSFHLTRGCSDFPQHLKPFAFDGASYQGMPDFVNKMIAYLKQNKPHLFPPYRPQTTEQQLASALNYGFEGSGGLDLNTFSQNNINAYHVLETATAGDETASSHYATPLAMASNRASLAPIASSSALQNTMPQQDFNNLFEFLVDMDDKGNPVQAVHSQQDKQQDKQKSPELS